MDERLTIWTGDALARLRELPSGYAQCVVTSPPYWGLRDYGVKGQLGLEPTFRVYVDRITEIFAEVHRVLKRDGTLWLNMGDTYTCNGGHRDDFVNDRRASFSIGERPDHLNRRFRAWDNQGVPQKSKLGMPWRVAFALQDFGWILRSDIIWHKPSPTPESVKDRPTSAHEYLFLFSKVAKYYYDAEAIKEPVSGNAHARGSGVNPKAKIPAGWDTEGTGKKPGRFSRVNVDRDPQGARQTEPFLFSGGLRAGGNRNKRDVWTVASAPYRGAHFATYPPKLVEPCILAGTRAGDLVLDPFGGSGTTAEVALKLGRRAAVIELNPEYVELIRKRTGKL